MIFFYEFGFFSIPYCCFFVRQIDQRSMGRKLERYRHGYILVQVQDTLRPIDNAYLRVIRSGYGVRGEILGWVFRRR